MHWIREDGVVDYRTDRSTERDNTELTDTCARRQVCDRVTLQTISAT